MQNEHILSLGFRYHLDFKLSHWQKQIIRLLSYNHRELSAHIVQEAERNPCLEIDYGENRGSGLIEQLCVAREDFRDELRLELALIKDEPLKNAAALLIGRLDDDGYLRAALSELAGETGIPEAVLDRALRFVQTLEPAGIGARSIKECFLLQLTRRSMQQSDAWALLTEAYAPLSRGDDAGVLRLPGWTEVRLQNARLQLSKLHPRPVDSGSAAQMVVPDACIVPCQRGGFTVELFDHALPKLSVSRSYLDSVRQNAAGKRFAHEGLFYAQRFLYCLERRNETLKNALQLAVDAQTAYLSGGQQNCLLMKDIATCLGLHPSVITRALSNKYVRMDHRVFAAKSLFARPCAPGVSSMKVRELLKACIAGEDARFPYSDQKLAQLMQLNHDIVISRRTVAKYRDEMHIAASSGRKI